MPSPLEKIVEENLLENAKICQSLMECAPDMERGAMMMFDSLIADGRIFVMGDKSASKMATILMARLWARPDEGKTAFPAYLLSGDGETMSSSPNAKPEEIYSKQISTLFFPKRDLLIAIAPDGDSPSAVLAIKAAKHKDAKILAMTSGNGGKLVEMLGAEDILINVPSSNPARIMEAHLLILDAMLDALDKMVP